MNDVKQQVTSGAKFCTNNAVDLLHSTSNVVGSTLIADVALRSMGQQAPCQTMEATAHKFQEMTGSTFGPLADVAQVGTGVLLLHTRDMTKVASDCIAKRSFAPIKDCVKFDRGSAMHYLANKTTDVFSSFVKVAGACTLAGSFAETGLLGGLAFKDCTFCMPTYELVSNVASKSMEMLGNGVSAVLTPALGGAAYFNKEIGSKIFSSSSEKLDTSSNSGKRTSEAHKPSHSDTEGANSSDESEGVVEAEDRKTK